MIVVSTSWVQLVPSRFAIDENSSSRVNKLVMLMSACELVCPGLAKAAAAAAVRSECNCGLNVPAILASKPG